MNTSTCCEKCRITLEQSDLLLKETGTYRRCVDRKCPCHTVKVSERQEMRESNFRDVNCPKCGFRNITGHLCDFEKQEMGWEKTKETIDFLKRILPYWEAEDLDDYVYIVHHYDLERVAKKLEDYITSQKAQESERVEKLLEALEWMYEQYCVNGHLFMSAGERASRVMEQYGYEFDGGGRLTKYPKAALSKDF